MEQGPQLRITANDNMATTATITTIRAAFGHILFPAQMAAAFTPSTGAAFNTDMIDEVHGGANVGIVGLVKNIVLQKLERVLSLLMAGHADLK